jgi:tRNA-dihydrouridine synthase B
VKKRMRQILAERAALARDAAAQAPPPARWPLAEPFRIGGLRLENRVVQAPLAGIANWAFRRQSRRHGAGLAVSEMVASFGIRYGNRKTMSMLAIAPDEHPVGVQVFGSDPGAMAEAARAAADAGADLVDVNMGCPVPKICKTGAGAALLAEPELASAVVEAMARAVDIPVTVKMRRGLTPSTAVPVETARRLEAAGAAALCVHPRAAAEEYEGRADHSITAEVVEAVSIPVIASGDVSTPEAARRVLDETGCAAIAVGRAALGYPWAFGDLLRGVPRSLPALSEVVEELSAFAGDARRALGDGRACVYMRKFYPWYLAGHEVPQSDLEGLLTDPTLDAALRRLRSLAAAPAAA